MDIFMRLVCTVFLFTVAAFFPAKIEEHPILIAEVCIGCATCMYLLWTPMQAPRNSDEEVEDFF